MVEKELIPTNEEINKWLLSTLRHSCHVEYFLNKLDLGHSDPERPHDLVGPGNKFEWDVIKGMALLYRDPNPDFKTYILPSINLHRQQYHHIKWNDPNPNDEAKPIPGATKTDMLVGAIDAACSLLETRVYSGGNDQNEQHGQEHSWKETEDTLYNKNPPHKVPWTKLIIPKMKDLKQPDLDSIWSLDSFRNIGLSIHTYADIVRITRTTLNTLKIEHNYDL
jgi:hypothetical protein|tara:strand:- start:99 stop:764 length:666 start_codon:yes stop_codon:yes gene_type:complete